MALHNDLGKEGEELAVNWLLTHGYEILHRNWRHSRYEIDIIATKNAMLHIIEVKSRYGSRYGHPETSVTKKKFRNLQRAADQFLFLYPGYKWIQYGILAITMYRNKEPEFLMLEDVYLW
jgi:putative endonuclease